MKLDKRALENTAGGSAPDPELVATQNRMIEEYQAENPDKFTEHSSRTDTTREYVRYTTTLEVSGNVGGNMTVIENPRLNELPSFVQDAIASK